MWDHLSEVPSLHLQLLFLGKKTEPVSEAMGWHCSFSVRGAEILAMMKSLGRTADISRAQPLSCWVKCHSWGLAARAAEVMV